MKYFQFLCLLIFLPACSVIQKNELSQAGKPQLAIPFDDNPNYSSTYYETIEWYQKLDAAFPEVKLLEKGSTDSGHPLHTAILSMDKDFDPVSLQM